MRAPTKCADCHTTVKKGDIGVEPTYSVCPRCRSRRGGKTTAGKRAIHHDELQRFGTRGGFDARGQSR